jgi:hypothetical protein
LQTLNSAPGVHLKEEDFPIPHRPVSIELDPGPPAGRERPPLGTRDERRGFEEAARGGQSRQKSEHVFVITNSLAYSSHRVVNAIP